jgi:integrase
VQRVAVLCGAGATGLEPATSGATICGHSVVSLDEPEEILARAARSGAHRDPSRPAVSVEEAAERERADEQDAALFIVAAFTGLRLGELLALRWRHVDFAAAKLLVEGSWSAGRITTPKSRKWRAVPLGQLHTALRQYKRGHESAARQFQLQLAAVLWRFLSVHEDCLSRHVGVDRFDIVTTVNPLRSSGTRACELARVCCPTGCSDSDGRRAATRR